MDVRCPDVPEGAYWVFDGLWAQNISVSHSEEVFSTSGGNCWMNVSKTKRSDAAITKTAGDKCKLIAIAAEFSD